MLISDYHIHTTFCDGRATPEEIILQAIEDGVSIVGFAGHSYMENEWFSMKDETADQYCTNIRELAEKYAGRIEVYCGIEKDFYSPQDMRRFQYVLGSVHYIKPEGVLCQVDGGRVKQLATAEKYFGGDIYAFCEAYYENMGLLAESTLDVVGHFDLVAAYNEKTAIIGVEESGLKYVKGYMDEKEPVFDINHPRYVKAWQDAMDTLLKKNAVFEMNVGCVMAGSRSEPFLSKAQLAYLADHGGKVIITSDSHYKNTVGKAYGKWYQYARQFGVTVLDRLPLGKT